MLIRSRKLLRELLEQKYGIVVDTLLFSCIIVKASFPRAVDWAVFCYQLFRGTVTDGIWQLVTSEFLQRIQRAYEQKSLPPSTFSMIKPIIKSILNTLDLKVSIPFDGMIFTNDSKICIDLRMEIASKSALLSEDMTSMDQKNLRVKCAEVINMPRVSTTTRNVFKDIREALPSGLCVDL